jgi:TfoX/Sxy family transcriptional regulator of competence genes
MLITHIHDDELLPISEQLSKIEKSASGLSFVKRNKTREQLTRLYNRLNREFTKSQVSVLDYVDLSIKLSQQRAALEVHL